MKIWVDADACPVVIKEILYKAAMRTHTSLLLVANRKMKIPENRYVGFLQVPLGQDGADKRIVEEMDRGDLVITSDIPLAAKVVEKGGLGLNPRGEIYTAENIKERLSSRDFFDSLRASGIETGGPSSLTKRDRQNFANGLDQILTKYKKKG